MPTPFLPATNALLAGLCQHLREEGFPVERTPGALRVFVHQYKSRLLVFTPHGLRSATYQLNWEYANPQFLDGLFAFLHRERALEARLEQYCKRAGLPT